MRIWEIIASARIVGNMNECKAGSTTTKKLN